MTMINSYHSVLVLILGNFLVPISGSPTSAWETPQTSSRPWNKKYNTAISVDDLIVNPSSGDPPIKRDPAETLPVFTASTPEMTLKDLSTDTTSKPQNQHSHPSNILDPLLNTQENMSTGSLISQTLSSPSDTPDTVLPLKHQPKPAIIKMSRKLHHFLKKILEVHEDEKSLEHLLTTLIVQYLTKCDLIIAVDRSFLGSQILEKLANFPNFKQVVFVESALDLLYHVIWSSFRCQGILLLLSDPEPLIDFGNQGVTYWDYAARVVIVGLTKHKLEDFILTNKGRKTQHIVGLLKGDHPGQYNIYMNQLFWGRGLAHITAWRGQSFTSKENLFPDKISNLHQAVLNVITFEFPPSIFYRRASNGSILMHYGWDVAVVKALAQVFHFTIVFREPGPGELWGERLSNGTWNGMVGLLGTGEGDLAIANLYISALLGRRQYQEFSTPFADDQSCWLARVDPPLPRWQSPGLPYQPQTWMLIFIGLIVAGPVLYGLAKASVVSGPEEISFQTFVTSSLYAYGVHCWQPMAKVPMRTSTQIFVFFLWLYAIILVTGYKSNLTAFLTVSRHPASIETTKELYESKLGVLGLGPFFKNSMASSGNQYLRGLATRFSSRSDIEEVKREVLAGEAIMINSKRYLEFLSAQLTTAQGIPLVRIMKECFSPYSVGIAYQSHSPLKQKFDRIITWMFESGLVRRWFLDSIRLYQKFKNQDAKEMQEEFPDDGRVEEVFQRTDGVIALGTDHLQGPFILLIFGYLMSAIVFAIEISFF